MAELHQPWKHGSTDSVDACHSHSGLNVQSCQLLANEMSRQEHIVKFTELWPRIQTANFRRLGPGAPH
jgi:hypothetical protein